jgi:hypothetical protein
VWIGWDDPNNKASKYLTPGSTGTPAKFTDPVTALAGKSFEFQTFAIVQSGPNKGKILGGITWKFKVSPQGQVEFLGASIIDVGDAANLLAFKDAVDLWNTQATGDPKNKNSPNQQVYNDIIWPAELLKKK